MAIHLLDKTIIQKIAAGEVVERPASVVKELIENSIDAGATNISVEIKDGGTSYIRVTDNGVGMSEEDSLLCFKQHATSKIYSEDDLFNISTLGFRGEAIPSIGAVSKMTLYTRQKDSEYAMQIKCHGGEIVLKERCGRPEGTTIIVEDIFYNVPARLKFLKKPSAEASSIGNIIQRYILARPDISFRFISSGRDVYISNGDNSLKNAIYSVYGKDFYANLIPVNYENTNIKITGFIGEPTIARATKSMQNLFINGRYVRSELISNSVKQGYLNRIMPAKHPFYALNLEIPFSDIDVNVHPNKLEVRFKEEGYIQECFFKAIKSAFDIQENKVNILEKRDIYINKHRDNDACFNNLVENNNIEYNNKQEIRKSLIDLVNNNVAVPEKPMPESNLQLSQSVGVLEDDSIMDTDEDDIEYKFSKKTDIEVVNVNREEKKTEAPSQTELQLTLSDKIGDYHIIGQIFNTYIIIEHEDKMLLIDQHAAHERINTNKMLKELEASKVLAQTLLIPCILQLTAEDFYLAMESQTLFCELGFEIEEFGHNTIRINTVPHIFGENNAEEFFYSTLDAIKADPKMDTRKDIIFETACKHSIKAGQRLTDDEIKELINISLKDKSPLNCPHGRPIVIIKTKKELEKWFMRIV